MGPLVCRITRAFALTVGLSGLLLLAGGCSSTRINFQGPPNSVLFLGDKPHHLPATVELNRPDGVGQSNRYDAALVFTGPNSEQVRAEGALELYGFSESEMDRMAVNTCHLDEAQLVKLLDGSVLVFKGQSASRQPLYELTLKKK